MNNLIFGIFVSFLAAPCFAANVDVAGHPTREHGRQLKRNIESLAKTHPPIAETQGKPLFYVTDDAEFIEMLLRQTSPQNYVREYWKQEIELVCGQEGEPQVFAALDDGLGTPTDWTRQVMVAKNKSDPINIYVGYDHFERLIVNRLSPSLGVKLNAVANGSDIHSDGRLLSLLKREGKGLAWIDNRHANAPGFAVSLYLHGDGTADVPALKDLSSDSFPTRFAALFTRKGAVSDTMELGKAACGDKKGRFLSADDVQARLDTLIRLHHAALDEEEKKQ